MNHNFVMFLLMIIHQQKSGENFVTQTELLSTVDSSLIQMNFQVSLMMILLLFILKNSHVPAKCTLLIRFRIKSSPWLNRLRESLRSERLSSVEWIVCLFSSTHLVLSSSLIAFSQHFSLCFNCYKVDCFNKCVVQTKMMGIKHALFYELVLTLTFASFLSFHW